MNNFDKEILPSFVMIIPILLASLCSTDFAAAAYEGAVARDAEDNDGYATLMQWSVDTKEYSHIADGEAKGIPPSSEQLVEVCSHQAAAEINKYHMQIPLICDGLEYHKKDYDEYRRKALEHPAVCLLNNARNVYDVLCKVCTEHKLVAPHSKSSLLEAYKPCAPRFMVARDWIEGLVNKTRRAATVEMLQNVTRWIEVESVLHKASWEEAWFNHTNLDLFRGSHPFMDQNGDGNITASEAAVYMKVTHMFAQICPEALVIALDRPFELLSSWGADTAAWVGGGLHDPEWLISNK